ncbi:MAG: glycosyltransferase [Barnesiella sp.]|nr:glycosyltransferase [Barnesiella sp.]
MNKLMENDPMVSVIMPVYNAQAYIADSIESVLSQSNQDFELLLINDGSTDVTGAICDEYSVKDSRVKVIHKENGGVSSARNVGIDLSRGKWVYFSDADDMLLPDCLDTLLNFSNKEEVCMVMAGYEVDNDGEISSTKPHDDSCITAQEGLMKLMVGANGQYQGYLWNKIFRRNIIEKKELRFDEDIYYNEDRLFAFRYLCGTEGVINITSKPVYRYFVRQNGAMSSIDGPKYRRFMTDLTAFGRIAVLAESTGDKKLIDKVNLSLFASYEYNRSLIYRNSNEVAKDIAEIRKEIDGYSVFDRLRYLTLLRGKNALRKVYHLLIKKSE